jgi:chromosome segregation ATPase
MANHWYVRGLSVQAFKSFGNTPTAVQFAPGGGITVIVGDNGVGKSALFEALLFALGAPASCMRVRLLREVVSSEHGSQVQKQKNACPMRPPFHFFAFAMHDACARDACNPPPPYS